MQYAHGISRATDLLRAATDFMGQRDIPPNPANYSVWYEYASEENPALKQEIRALIEAGVGIDEQLSRRLYESYFGFTNEGREIADVGAKLNAQMHTIGRDLEHAGKETGDHCKTLLAMIDGGVLAASPEHVLSLLRSVIAEAQDIVETNQVLEGQLVDAASEIDGLKENLETVRKEAMSDPLTGVVNRKYLEVRLAEQCALSTSTGQDLCLILLDIDNFKKFNDKYGHQVGDQVLKVVARAIDDSIRGGDTLARYGGEEFCVILPNTGLDGGAAVAENIRRSMASKVLKSGKDGRDYGTVTASFGVADNTPGEAAEDLVARADAALYTAKNDGRNQIVVKSRVAAPA